MIWLVSVELPSGTCKCSGLGSSLGAGDGRTLSSGLGCDYQQRSFNEKLENLSS